MLHDDQEPLYNAAMIAFECIFREFKYGVAGTVVQLSPLP